MEDPLRVRVAFDDRKMLTKSQRSEGLKHCWILLRPDIATISDLALHVHRSFNLQRSCPNGLLLSMDGFVLPPFESTCVLKDKDTIRVRKKVATQMSLIELGDDPCSMRCSGSLKKQHIVSGGDFLAIREFGECSDCKMKYHEDFCAHTENVVSTGTPPKSKKKRKHSDGIQSPKRKKLRTSSQKPNITGNVVEDAAEADEDTHLGKSLESSKKRCSSKKRSKKKQKPSTANGSIASQLEDKVEQLTSSNQKRKRTNSVLKRYGRKFRPNHR
ncbi:coilin-like [Asparagus officinalis]|uniref:coilin-like n=1 Tax=Asparagus officinalis TaxID=4686 RepID=UPI00098E0E11|nr:coilin-like [Asparagus officinalis]